MARIPGSFVAVGAQAPMQRAGMMPALQGIVEKFKPILESFKNAAAGGGNGGGATDAGGLLTRLAGQWSWLKDALSGVAGTTGAPAPGAQEGMDQVGFINHFHFSMISLCK